MEMFFFFLLFYEEPFVYFIHSTIFHLRCLNKDKKFIVISFYEDKLETYTFKLSLLNIDTHTMKLVFDGL